MFIAVDKNKKRVHASKVNNDEQYFCPVCNKPVFLRKGQIYAHHFAHSNNSNCLDNWKHDMSEWHLNWQNKFPLECQEVVMNSGGETHRADVFINGIVYEFQHSSMLNTEFEERNKFYNSLGYKVIWVFDLIEEKKSRKIFTYPSRFHEWSHPKSTFKNFNPDNPMISVFFQFYPENERKTGFVEKVTWHCEVGFHFFSTDGFNHDHDMAVLNYVLPKKLFYREKIYDEMLLNHSAGRVAGGHAFRFKNCPISPDGYAYSNSIDGFSPACSGCKHSFSHKFLQYCCKYAADELAIPERATIYEIFRAENGMINGVSFELNGEYFIKKLKDNHEEGETLFGLWLKNQPCSSMIVQNLFSKYYFRITKDPNWCLKRYQRVYGDTFDPTHRFTSSNVVIKHPEKKQWKLIDKFE